jgi:hypothetical protein
MIHRIPGARRASPQVLPSTPAIDDGHDPVSADNQVTCATCMYPAGRPCRSRPASNTYQAAAAVSFSSVTGRNWVAGASLGMRIHSAG